MKLRSPRNWEHIPFGQVVAHSAFGPRFSGDDYADDGNVATLRTTDIEDDGRISYENMPLARLNEDNFTNHLLKPGDLVITRSGTCGIAAVFTGFSLPVLPGAFLIRFRLNERADPRFFRYYFNSSFGRTNILSVARGAVQQNLNITNVETLRVPLPPLQEQERIVATLSAYDELMENNRRQMGLLEEAARLLYREWFVHLRFPGHEHSHLNRGLPEGWRKKSLGEEVEIKKGRNITLATVEDGIVPVVAGGLTPAYYHSEANVMGPAVTISASGANAGFVNIYYEDIWASDCSYVSSESTRHLFYYYCLLKFRQGELFGFQKGAAQPHVYPKDLMRLTVTTPPENILQNFIDVVTPFFASIKNLERQNKLLVKARDLLLPRLMSGVIDV